MWWFKYLCGSGKSSSQCRQQTRTKTVANLLISASFWISVDSPLDLLKINKHSWWFTGLKIREINTKYNRSHLPSASSCPSMSKRNLFRGLGAEPPPRLLLRDQSALLTISLIFWNLSADCWDEERDFLIKSNAIKIDWKFDKCF